VKKQLSRIAKSESVEMVATAICHFVRLLTDNRAAAAALTQCENRRNGHLDKDLAPKKDSGFELAMRLLFSCPTS